MDVGGSGNAVPMQRARRRWLAGIGAIMAVGAVAVVPTPVGSPVRAQARPTATA